MGARVEETTLAITFEVGEGVLLGVELVFEARKIGIWLDAARATRRGAGAAAVAPGAAIAASRSLAAFPPRPVCPLGFAGAARPWCRSLGGAWTACPSRMVIFSWMVEISATCLDSRRFLARRRRCGPPCWARANPQNGQRGVGRIRPEPRLEVSDHRVQHGPRRSDGLGAARSPDL